jgi:hypothetical protein
MISRVGFQVAAPAGAGAAAGAAAGASCEEAKDLISAAQLREAVVSEADMCTNRLLELLRVKSLSKAAMAAFKDMYKDMVIRNRREVAAGPYKGQPVIALKEKPPPA